MAVKTDIQLAADATQVQNETAANANTAARVGLLFNEVNENKINKDKIAITLGATPTDSKVASEKCVKEAIAVVAAAITPALGFTAENAANKSTSIATDTGSNTKYPTVKAVQDAIALIPTSSLPYKLVAGKFNIGSGAISGVNIFTNTTTATTFTFSVAGNGFILCSANSAVWTSGKTFLTAPALNNGGQPYFLIGSSLSSATDFYIDIIKFDGTQTGTPNSSNIYFEIKVYP